VSQALLLFLFLNEREKFSLLINFVYSRQIILLQNNEKIRAFSQLIHRSEFDIKLRLDDFKYLSQI
jgi:hypothetical protein